MMPLGLRPPPSLRMSVSPRSGGKRGGGDPDAVSHAWVPDKKEVWRLATVDTTGAASDHVRVHVAGAEPVEVPCSATRVWDPSHALYLEDAARLNNLHEAALLNLLRSRFEGDDIYTYTGNVLISLNPYKDIPLLYDMPDDNSRAIARRVTVGEGRPEKKLPSSGNDADGDFDDDEEELPVGQRSPRAAGGAGSMPRHDTVLDHPHVYAVADKAHRYMTDPDSCDGGASGVRKRCRDQSIIITGESGAGKTEAAKYVMKYLIAASQVVSGRAEGSLGARIERCLVQSTVVLEAFGNAKTVRNDNSSRFGKYIKLQYDATWQLVGARTLHFLLEKSRLVGQDSNERNYHIFYQLCRGVPREEAKALRLREAAGYELLRQGGIFTQSDEVDDAAEFCRVAVALETLGVAEHERSALWRVLAALLHLGNITFRERSEDEDEGATSSSADVDAGHVGAGGSGRQPLVNVVSPEVPLAEVAAMVGLPTGLLANAIRTRTTLTGRGSWFEIPLDAAQSRDNLHALIKHVYGQLFAWLVMRINRSHANLASAKGKDDQGEEEGSAVVVEEEEEEESAAFIGILDIFGFEIMARNSFEQLCINFANEVLQQQFNQHVFVLEQEEYVREGIDWTVIHFTDNQPVIDLLSKKPTGLLLLLEEQGLLGRKADNQRLLQLYHQTHLGQSVFYGKPRFEGPEFIVKHFAGDVTYDVTAFLEKNSDSLHDNLLDLLDASDNSFLRELCDFRDRDAVAGIGLDGTGGAGNSSGIGFGGFGKDGKDAFGLPATPGTVVSSPYQNGGAFFPNGGTQSESPTAHGREASSGMDSLGPLPPPAEALRGHRGSGSSVSSGNGGLSGASPLHAASFRRVGSRMDNRNARQEASGSKNKVHQIATTVTVSKMFRWQLGSLMATLRATEPHYIKCIKPNNVKAPGGFSPHLVQQQLNYSGVLEVVRIRREAYPMRVPFLEFYERFQLLHDKLGGAKAGIHTPPPDQATPEEAKAACERILKAHLGGINQFQLGHSQVFLREEGIDVLRSAIRIVYHKAAASIQAGVRAFIASRKLRRQRSAAVLVQKATRMFHKKKSYLKAKEQVTLIQRWWRGQRLRRLYQGDRASAVRIQAAVRGLLARRRRSQATEAVVTIQALGRRVLAQRAYGQALEAQTLRQEQREHRAAVAIQAAWRSTVAMRTFGGTRLAAVMLQRWWREAQRRGLLRRMVAAAFRWAAEGNVNALAAVIKQMPEVLFIRDRNDLFKTLLHAAACSGSTSLASLLDPLPEDVFAVDADGNTPLHYAAGACKYELVKFLASKANNTIHMPSERGSGSSGGSGGGGAAEVMQQERRATKRISVRIITEARLALAARGATRPLVRRGSVQAARPRSPGMDIAAARDSGKPKPIYQGWLLKRREMGGWQRRWCVLTELTLDYYHSVSEFKAGKTPARRVTLNLTLLKKSPPQADGGDKDKEHCFELHSPELLSRRNGEGRLYFRAASEEDCYAWLVPLRVLAGSHTLGGGAAAGTVKFLDVRRRAALVGARNRRGETPLHFAAGPPGTSVALHVEARAIARVQIAAWLVEGGADPNAACDSGDTALHTALRCGNPGVAAALARKGGDLSIAGEGGRSCLDLAEGPEAVEELAVGYYKAAERQPLLGPPVRLTQLTYVTFHLEKLAMHTTAELCNPFLTVAVYDAHGTRIEKPQDVISPVLTRPGYLWWAATWHMQNPLENLGAGSTLIFELRTHDPRTDEVATIAWAMHQLSSAVLNTQEVSMEMYEAPVDPTLQRLVAADLFLSADVSLTTSDAGTAAATQIPV